MKGSVKIDETLCKGCTYCVSACPAGALGMSGHFNRDGYYPAISVAPDKCNGCALCAETCPEVAIEVYRGK